jgi:hypothetical protein
VQQLNVTVDSGGTAVLVVLWLTGLPLQHGTQFA